MKVIRSTNSSIESDLPSRSARSSRWMATFVKDASDVFSVFIQFQGTGNEKAVRWLSEPSRGSGDIMERHDTVGHVGAGEMDGVLVRGCVAGGGLPATR